MIALKNKTSTKQIIPDSLLNIKKHVVSDDTFLLHTPEDITIGVRVHILWPEYVAGEVGVVCGREVLPGGKHSNRWLAQVNSQDMIVSLTPEEFRVLNLANSAQSPRRLV